VSSRWRLELDRESFLADYWQRKPLFIPGAIAGFVPPIDANELAGLALEPEIESRLIEQREGHWQLQHGPFVEADFNRTTNWTLLVQAVDHLSDAVADLRKLVDFIPQWRIDDVMVSYATDGGSVGPHYDNYDVFLLQGEGQRRWRLGQQCDSDTALLEHDELRILAQFDQTQEYLLHPGDILYVPPGVAHWGIAQGECTTFSIGFRAPRINDLLSRRVDQLLESLNSETFYTDAGRAAPTRPGEILQADINRANEALQQAMQMQTQDNWFGELVTQPKTPGPNESSHMGTDLFDVALERGYIDLAPECKLAWQEHASGITVYANGATVASTPEILPVLLQLCADWRLDGSTLSQALAHVGQRNLLEALAEHGCLYVRD
jgi:50S ribosomal protein L16 3-hydroxylase